MPPEVAGVTFLAFGNGAPDVFSAFVALTSSLDRQEGLLVGMGSLLGSSEPGFSPRVPPMGGLQGFESVLVWGSEERGLAQYSLDAASICVKSPEWKS